MSFKKRIATNKPMKTLYMTTSEVLLECEKRIARSKTHEQAFVDIGDEVGAKRQRAFQILLQKFRTQLILEIERDKQDYGNNN